MGADQSSLSNSDGLIHHGPTPNINSHGFIHHEATTTNVTPRVIQLQAFHSSSKWRNHFNNIKGSTQLMVIDFTASWCGPCKLLEPILLELAAKFTNVIFVKIDVDECMEVSREYGVESMPTLVLMKHGMEVDRIIGAKKDELERKITKHLTQL